MITNWLNFFVGVSISVIAAWVIYSTTAAVRWYAEQRMARKTLGAVLTAHVLRARISAERTESTP